MSRLMVNSFEIEETFTEEENWEDMFSGRSQLAILASESTSVSAEEAALCIALQRYFSARATEQRKLRLELIDLMGCSETLQDQVLSVLDYVAKARSEESLISAIELLSLLGEKLEAIARPLLRHVQAAAPRAIFVLGSAVARNSLADRRNLLMAEDEILQEAALDTFGSDSSAMAKPLLNQYLNRTDLPGYLRDRAKEVIEGFE